MEKPWFKFYDDGVPRTVEIPPVTMPHFFDEAVRRYPSHPVAIFFGKKFSYRDMDAMVNRFAARLAELGVKKGDRIALILPNLPQYPVCHFAAMKLGAIIVPTNPLYVERELENQLKSSGAETVVVLDLLFPRLMRVKAATAVKNIIVAGVKDYLPQPLKSLYPIKQWREGHRVKIDRGPGVYFFTELMKGDGALPPKVDVKPEDIAIFMYTGGTTGISKGAVLTHRNLVANVTQIRHWLRDLREGGEVILSALPFFHSYGMTACLHLGVVLASTLILIPRFDIKMVLGAINKYRVTIFPGVPTMYVAVNNYPKVGKYNLRSIKACVSGGAALPVEVARRFEEITGGKLVEGYGLSEASPVSHVNPIQGTRKAGSIGVPIPNTDARVVDPQTRKPLPVGEIGELAISGPQVMQGYWQMEDETRKVLQEGWLFTGDMAKMDEDGYFFIVDRKKDMIISGGFNIYPREVEEVLYTHPKVLEAAVIGVPDAYRGEVVKAFVVLKPNETTTEEEIVAYCQEKLAKFKVPKYIEFRDQLPKTLIGKVLRRVLVEEEQAKRAGAGQKVA